MTIEPDAYRLVERWGQLMGSTPDYVRRQQEQAARDGAPLNAIYWRVADRVWVTADQVTLPDTLAFLRAPEKATK